LRDHNCKIDVLTSLAISASACKCPGDVLTLRGFRGCFAEHLSQQLLTVDSVALLCKGRTQPGVRVAQRAHNTVSVESGGEAGKTHNVAIECVRLGKRVTTR